MIALLASAALAVTPPITDENQLPAFTLPDVLAAESGEPAVDAADWTARVRPELLELFAHEIYGVSPDEPVEMTILDPVETAALGDKAVFHQAVLEFHSAYGSARLNVLAVLPANPKGPVPLFVALNLRGNQTLHDDHSIRLPLENDKGAAEAAERGAMSRRWPFEEIVEAGWGLVTASSVEVAPEPGNRHQEGVLKLFPAHPDSPMGVVGAWAWTLSRMAEYAATLPGVDVSRTVVVGHSRLGKAALWAAAQDQRFAAAVSNSSGCIGAALSRRRFGESLATIMRNYPYWFTPKLAAYANNEDSLPVDQHHLLALIAPRPVLVLSAQEDLWADPRGEFLSTREAARAYALFGPPAMLPDEPPPVGELVGDRIAYRCRPGKHDLTPADWASILEFTNSRLAPHPAEVQSR